MTRDSLTRYLIGFSPYRNGSYVVRNAPGSRAEYVLYSSSRTPFLPNRDKHLR